MRSRPLLTNGSDAIELARRDIHNIAVKGRLKPGVSVEQAAEDVALIGRNLERAYPDTNRNQGLTAQTEFDARVEARPQLAVGAVMLMTMSMTVLLVACANVAGLLTSRAPVRAREMALRLAIGAGRARLTRQLIVESLLIAIGGSAFGLLIASAVISMFQRLQLPTDVPLEADVRTERSGFASSASSSPPSVRWLRVSSRPGDRPGPIS